MAKKLFIELQTPVVEIPVKAKDISNKESEIIIGFNRYESEEADKIIEKFKKIFELSEDKEKTAKLDEFIKGEISYIKKATILIYDDSGAVETLQIEDTRTQKAYEGLWDSPSQCLEILLGKYLKSSPWKIKIHSAYQSVLFNVNLDAITASGN